MHYPGFIINIPENTSIHDTRAFPRETILLVVFLTQADLQSGGVYSQKRHFYHLTRINTKEECACGTKSTDFKLPFGTDQRAPQDSDFKER